LRLPPFATIFARAVERPREAQMWSWQQAASWQDFAALGRRMAANEQGLRRKLWRMLLREAASLPFAEQLLTAHYCAFDRQTPLYVRAILVGAIVYFIVPDRFVPKNLPLIALADDAAVLAAAFKTVSSHIKPEHKEAAQRTLTRLRGAR
jgi:uncharacterized membrane protein YkvA (DUF1232 family)